MFNFWPFNVARKRREEAHRQAQERLIAAFREDCQQRAKRNKVIPMSDPHHPRNLSPQQRADRIAALRNEAAEMFARESERQAAIARARRNGVVLVDDPAAGFGNWRNPAPVEDTKLVQQFRCDHPAISEFWQEQQARCDSPTDTSSPSCDAPPTDN